MSILDCYFEIKIVVIFIHSHVSRKVAGSIPNEVIGFFDRPNSSSRTMVLDVASNTNGYRNFPGVKGDRPADA
jgi:hypothetical protein